MHRVISPHRMHTVLDAAVLQVSVCCAKTAELIEIDDMSSWMKTRVDPKKRVLNGGSRSPWKGDFWGGGMNRPIVKYRNYAGLRCACIAYLRLGGCTRLQWQLCS